MLFLSTRLPSLHFGHFLFSIFSVVFLAGHSLFMHTICGRLPFLMTETIGCKHASQILSVVLINPLLGRLNVVLHFGYWSHAINLPNLPFLIISFPFLHAGHEPTVFSFWRVSLVAVMSPLPISFSLFLNSFSILVRTFFASFRTSSFFFLFLLISSISFSKCRVSASSIMLGQCFSRVSISFMPRSVASIDVPCTYPRWNRVSIISLLVAFVPRFLFSSTRIIDAGVYLFGGSVSFCISSVFLFFTLPFSFSSGSSS